MDRTTALLCTTVALALHGWAQTPPQATTPGGLKIVIVEGENAMNNTVTRTAVQPVVEVRDEADKPVAGADVEFTLPWSGPGGSFETWTRKQTVKSDAQGRATAHGFTPNDQAGRFKIVVTAQAGTKSGTGTIAQTNSASGNQGAVKKNNNKLYVILGVVAVGAIAGGVAASRSGSSAAVTPANPVTIGAGPISVGGPR